MLGIEVESMKALAIGVIVVLVVIAAIAVKVIVNGTVRLLTVALVVAAGVLVWSQRQALQDCAEDVKDEALLATDGEQQEPPRCRFLGFEVTVDLPELDVPGQEE
ncbi:MAG: hypothetical protein WAS51_04545 [Ilumatobacteraceae bacterium]|nr:MAG: hypothetical protein IPM43_15280 [Actinomycetota bacterium]